VSGAQAAGRLPTVVFDFAGVVFQWQPLQLLQQVIPQRATDAQAARHWAAEIFQAYGGDWAEFDRGTVSPADLVQRIGRRTGLAPAEVRAVVDAVPLSFQPMADTVVLLRQLHTAGHPIYFLSNMPAPYADHLDRQNDFLRLFRDGIYSARVQQVKPDPAIYHLAAQRFGVPPGDLLFFDDVVANVAAAQAAGWQAAHFTSAAAAAAVLQAAGFDLGR
jgi:putative hydrolase of the HAD superfamily